MRQYGSAKASSAWRRKLSRGTTQQMRSTMPARIRCAPAITGRSDLPPPGVTAASTSVMPLALGGVDLTSSTGKLTMNVINAVAEFERDLLVERTQAGLSRAKSEGKTLGRPPSLTDDQRRAVEQRLEEGATVSALAREFKTSRNTIMRVRDAISAPR